MVFNSINFLIFFPVVVLIYYIIPHKIRYIWLLLASYYFYMAWNPVFSLLMLASTLISYTGGILLDRINNYTGGGNKAYKSKKYVAIITILFNVLLLFFFKYFYFAVDNINIILSALHIQLIQPKFDIILPLGISFYTMQIIAYIVDIYRGTRAEKNFIRGILHGF